MQHQLKAGKNSRRLSQSQRIMIVIAVMALVVFYAVFFIFPIGYALTGSFFNWMPTKRVFSFVGLENYRKIFEQSTLGLAMGNTLVFTVVVTLGRTLLGLFFAALIYSMRRGRVLFRTIYFIPVITSTVAVSMVWKWMYEPSNGPLNYYLSLAGIAPQRFLIDSSQAMWCVMAMTIWKETGYAMVMYMAGMTGIPGTLYEAAEMDGCTHWQAFRYITFPLLKTTTEFILLTSFVTYCQTFTQIDLMTKGGPGKASYTMVYYLYQEAFGNNRFGRASAIAFVLFAVILVFSVLQLRITRTKEAEKHA
ncbi:MAG: sugar ABC transporter permease [Clostridia bacterium]|nr:sugar ABC transporter permease [Clostridia bacterium]